MGMSKVMSLSNDRGSIETMHEFRYSQPLLQETSQIVLV